MFEAQSMNARMSYRVTIPELELPKWNAMQKKYRLTGLSLTGYQDMVNATNMSLVEQKTLLQQLKQIAIESANLYADQLGLNRSELVTTVKPEGTLSLLPTVSSGLHMNHSDYYIRRIRINSQDPLCKTCESLGYPVFPEVGQDQDNPKTKVIEFPVKAPEGRTKYDVSAIEQLEIYKMFMEHYVDHNTSITVHVRNHEWEAVEQWVWDNWDAVVAISFLSLDDNFYELLPYEAIDETEYTERLSKIGGKRITPDKIAKYEIREQSLDSGSDGCDAGVCPIR
jgi:ribonucleoside-diphosphate reductase alpha chain/ribonucleoside-triphosphate reductase